MLFRSKALKAYTDPVSKGGLLEITAPWTVVLFFALLGVVAVLAAILIFGRASVAVHGPGLVRPEGGPIVLVATRSAYVERVAATEGNEIAKGGEIVSFTDPVLTTQTRTQEQLVRQLSAALPAASLPEVLDVWGAEKPETVGTQRERLAAEEKQLSLLRAEAELLRMQAPTAGTVVHIHVQVGEYVLTGAPVATLLPAHKPLVGYVAMPEKNRPNLRPGAKMRLRLDAYPAREKGFGVGTVRRIGTDLLTEAWEKRFSTISGGPLPPSVLVEVSLDGMPPQAKGRFENGMVFTGEVVVGEQPIAAMIL